jgi:hypothetical protein
LFNSIATGSPALAHAARLFLLLFAAMLALQLADPRLINGADPWVKPAKFFLSLGLHMATLAWGMSLLDDAAIRRFRLNGTATLFIALATLEMIYMIYRASRGEASHFNRTSDLAEILYGLMGAAALGLMATTAWLGIALLRAGRPPQLARLVGTSFIVSAILTSFVGMYLGQQPSHWIGGDQTDATGLPFFGWSTTGGDLRPAHFMASHILQVVPAIAVLVGPRAAWPALIGTGVATALLFLLAISGIPAIAI